MKAERHSSLTAALVREWDDLADRADAQPWVRPGWIEAWWKAFGHGELEIVALRRHGALAAVVPLVRRRGALFAPANWHTPEFELLAADDDAREALARELFAGRPRQVDLSFFPSDDGDVCEAAAHAAGYRVLRRAIERSPFVPVEGDVDSYEAERDRKMLKEVRRRLRRLGDEGELRVDVAQGDERLDDLLAEGFAVEASGWKREDGTAIVSRPDTHRFYTDVARWGAERGFLRLAFLRLDGRPIAFEFLFQSDGRLYDLKGGYDPEFAKFGPGQLLAHAMISRAFEQGLRSFEFLGSEEPWKMGWADRVRVRTRFQAFAPSPAGTAAWAAYRWVRPVAKRVLALRPGK